MGKNKGKKKPKPEEEKAPGQPGPSQVPQPQPQRASEPPAGSQQGKGQKGKPKQPDEKQQPVYEAGEPGPSSRGDTPRSGGDFPTGTKQKKGKQQQQQSQTPRQRQESQGDRPESRQEQVSREQSHQQQQRGGRGPPQQQGQPARRAEQAPQETSAWRREQQVPPGFAPPQQGPQPGVPQQPAWRGQQEVRGPPQQYARGPPQQQPRGPPPQQAGIYPQGPPQQQPRGPPRQQAEIYPQGVPQQQPGGPPQQVSGGPQQQPRGPPQQVRGHPPQQPSQQHVTSQQKTPQPPQQQTKGKAPSQQQPPRAQLQQQGGDQRESRQQTFKGDAAVVSKNRFRPGTRGRPIIVESTHFSLDLGKLKEAIHYDVAITPDKPKKFLRTVFESFRKKCFPNRYPAFDGQKNAYTTSPLTNNINDYFEEEISIREEDGREKMFKLEMKFANRVDLTPLHNMIQHPATPTEALQVVDIVLRSAPVLTCIPVGRSFFVKPQKILDLGQGMEMYAGFYQSAIRGWKPLLNVDVSHKAFPKDINVVDALVDLLSTGRDQFSRDQLRSLNQWQSETLNNYIKTLKVFYTIPGHPASRKSYRVNGIGEPASQAEFKLDNGTSMTVAQYFQRTKHYQLRYPDLPTLWVGSTSKKILLPMELCQIEAGQALNRKMTELQTSKMIRYAATDTHTRKEKIRTGLRQANYNSNPCIKEFGFSVGNEFQKLQARVLDPPPLQYANRQVNVSRGVWRNEGFLNAVTINKWTIANVNRYPIRSDEAKRMSDLLERSARDVGINLAKATLPFTNVGGRQSYPDIEQYFKSQKEKKFDVIFVVVPDSGPQYSYVKKAAEIVVGCLTQCIKSSTLGRKMNQQTAINILLKVNSKLNGVNHALAKKPPLLQRPVMIMGADVTHPSPDSRDIPSVAAVTASHDPKAFQYNICWRLQNPKAEIIVDLENIMIEQLKFFYKKTNCKPEAIVFFRDGVSEGQFEQVQHAEIRAIRAACKKIQADGFEPKITFLVVQKRHHTRLFPTDPKDSHDKNFNVPAGTCVDTEITHPFMQDFYLVSHASIQGVAKPTKYVTLWDENNISNDDVEELAYYLCHMFTRCNRSVSYPAPTYYAHLAAARAKVYIENDRLDMSKLSQIQSKYEIKDEIRKERPMFFV